MAYLLSAFAGISYLKGHNDDDWTDRLHYQVTSNILICLSILVSFKQFGGRPMECMLPSELPESWEQYAENFCWAQDTYYLSYDQDLTRVNELRNARIGYYQWVPFYFLLAALSFQIPGQIWRFLYTGSGINLESLIDQATDPKNVALEARQYATRVVAIYLENALQFQRRLYGKRMVPHKVIRFLNLPYKHYFITMVYIVAKFLYLTNVFVQFLFMNFFLQSGATQDAIYGWKALVTVTNGTKWSQSGFFPRDTLCDFQVRIPGHVNNYSIQCVLSINLFSEKIFVFLWFWFHILAVITGLSLMYWIVVCVFPRFPLWFVVRHLELSDMPFDPSESQELVNAFVNEYLRTDGLFILHMLNLHTGAIFSSELMATLYKSYGNIEALIKSVQTSHGKWPSLETLQRMRSRISGQEEIRHPPPPPPPIAPYFDQGRQQKRGEDENEQKQRERKPFLAGHQSEAAETGKKHIRSGQTGAKAKLPRNL